MVFWRRAYDILLRLYPRDYRAMFAGEMRRAFAITSEERRSRGRSALVRFVACELTGLVKGVGAEWIAKLSTDGAIRGRTLPDRLHMRPPGVSWEAHYAGAFPDELMQAERQTDFLVSRIVHAIARHRWEDARFYDFEERKSRDNLQLLRRKYHIGE